MATPSPTVDRLTAPKQSLGDLCTVHQNLLELVRAHPDDTNLVICLAEAERQRDIAWRIHQERKRALI